MFGPDAERQRRSERDPGTRATSWTVEGQAAGLEGRVPGIGELATAETRRIGGAGKNQPPTLFRWGDLLGRR